MTEGHPSLPGALWDAKVRQQVAQSRTPAALMPRSLGTWDLVFLGFYNPYSRNVLEFLPVQTTETQDPTLLPPPPGHQPHPT